MEDTTPTLFKKAVEYLIKLGYCHMDHSLYYKNDGKSLGIGLSWNNPNDGRINIMFFSEEANDSGQCIPVDSLGLAICIIDNFNFLNDDYVEKLLDAEVELIEVTRL